MLSTPIAAAFGERIPDKFRSRADAYRGIGLTVGQLVGVVAAVLLVETPVIALRLCAVVFLAAAVVVVLVLPRERSSVELRSGRSNSTSSSPATGSRKTRRISFVCSLRVWS